MPEERKAEQDIEHLEQAQIIDYHQEMDEEPDALADADGCL